MQISTLPLVGKELLATHVHSRMHLLERHISPAGMAGEGIFLYVVVNSLVLKFCVDYIQLLEIELAYLSKWSMQIS